MIGARELLFGALLLGAKTPETRRAAVLASAAVDVLDLAATIWGWEMGQVSTLVLVAFSFCHQVLCLYLGTEFLLGRRLRPRIPGLTAMFGYRDVE